MHLHTRGARRVAQTESGVLGEVFVKDKVAGGVTQQRLVMGRGGETTAHCL